MSLTLVTGPPGTGKTWFAIRRLLAALQAGLYVSTNVQLHDGWALQFARMNWIDRLADFLKFNHDRVERKAAGYERRMFVSGDLTELFALRLPPCRKCKGCKKRSSCQREGRGIMILDEAHEWLNARMWDIDHTGAKLDRETAVQNRLRVVKFFALHRKLGWDVYLITQSEKRLDNQVRDNFEFHTKLKNMHKFKVWGLFPVVPFNWFWAITWWHASGGERVGIQSYLLTKLADCYDTMARPELPMGTRELEVIELPLCDDDIVARKSGEWVAPYLLPDLSDRTDGRPDGGVSVAPPRLDVRPVAASPGGGRGEAAPGDALLELATPGAKFVDDDDPTFVGPPSGEDPPWVV